MEKRFYIRTIYNEIDCNNYEPLSTYIARIFRCYTYGSYKLFYYYLNYLNYALLNGLYKIY